MRISLRVNQRDSWKTRGCDTFSSNTGDVVRGTEASLVSFLMGTCANDVRKDEQKILISPGFFCWL